MRNMRKAAAVLLATGMVFALTACGGNKKVEMLNLRDLEETTGYIRGGCSPIGMKKLFPTYIDHKAETLEEIVVSAGKRGLQMGLAPQALQQLTRAIFADLLAPEHE